MYWSADKNAARGSQEPNPVLTGSDSSEFTDSVFVRTLQNTAALNNRNPVQSHLSAPRRVWYCPSLRYYAQTHTEPLHSHSPPTAHYPSYTGVGTRAEWRKDAANVVFPWSYTPQLKKEERMQALHWKFSAPSYFQNYKKPSVSSEISRLENILKNELVNHIQSRLSLALLKTVRFPFPSFQSPSQLVWALALGSRWG